MSRFHITLIILIIASTPLLLFSGDEEQQLAANQEPGTQLGEWDTPSFAELDRITETVRLYERALEVVADNLVNADTTGFKARRPRFSQSSEGLVLRVERSFAQGRIVRTEDPLDLAIDGDAFLRVRSADGRILYTRDGAVQLTLNGTLVTSDGLHLIGAPTLPLEASSSELIVQRDGTVLLRGSRPEDRPSAVGSIMLARFTIPAGLKAEVGQHVYAQTFESGDPMLIAPGMDGDNFLLQGCLESSNVSFEEERLRARHLERRLKALIEIAE